MEYRWLGTSGLQVSQVGLGCNAFGSRTDADTAAQIIWRAAELGVTLLDTADMYSGTESEEIVGRALRSLRRDEVVLATKGGAKLAGGRPNGQGASRQHLSTALEQSLRRLGTEYVDVYYVHFPDPSTRIEETLRFLDDMVTVGKIRYVGVSNFAAWQVCQLLWAAEKGGWAPVHTVQVSHSLVDRTAEAEMLPLCRELGVGVIGYWPLGGGLLTGKYRPGEPPPPGSRVLTQPVFESSFTDDRLRYAAHFVQVADRASIAPAALALRWALRTEGISAVLVGATRVDQLTESLSNLDSEVDDKVFQELDEMSDHARLTPLR